MYDKRWPIIAFRWLTDSGLKPTEKDVAALSQELQDTAEQFECAAQNPRERGGDDGIEYADPRDEMERRLRED